MVEVKRVDGSPRARGQSLHGLNKTALPGREVLNQSMLSYYLYRLAGFIVPLIPPRLGYWLSSRLGDILFRLLKEARSAVRDNVIHILGRETDKAAIDRTVREVFRNSAKNYFDLFRVPALSAGQIRKMVRIHGWENVDRALAAGKGLIVVSAHFGNVDVVAQVLAHPYKITVVAEHLKPEVLFQYICDLRGSKGIKLIPIDGPLLGLFRALRRNEIVGLAADLDITGSGVVVDFFGEPVQLPSGHVRLALRTGAMMVMGFSLRLADNTFALHIEPPLELEATGDFQRDVRVNTEQVVAVLERYIGQHPEQWVMFRPIWRMADSK